MEFKMQCNLDISVQCAMYIHYIENFCAFIPQRTKTSDAKNKHGKYNN